MLKHIVMWKMDASESPEALDAFRADLERMATEIPEVVELSVGRLIDDSRFDAALCVDLADVDALERYRVHPAHLPRAQTLRKVSSEICAADYTF